ncbi:MAG: ferredoxin--NADP reductase [Nitrospiria bacterium]
MARTVHLSTLERIETSSSSVKSFFLRLPPGQKLEFKAGQFISVHVPKEGKIIRKPYSVASPPFDPTLLELCIKRVEGGFVSNTFFSYQEGTPIPIDGPDGVFILRNPFLYDLCFIGTGTGIAPLRSMIQWLFYEGFSKRLCLIFGVRNENEILYEKEFKELEKKHSNFQFVPTLSRPIHWQGETGYVQEKIGKFIGNAAGKEAYVCGLAPMIDAVKEKLKSAGFDRKQIHYEKYV